MTPSPTLEAPKQQPSAGPPSRISILLGRGLLLAGLVGVSLSCQRAPEPAGTPPPAKTVSAAAALPETAAAAPVLAALPPDLIEAFVDRQRCNLLKGCDPADALVALGASAVDAACTFYEESARDADRYYRSRVLQALGRMGGEKAEACLLQALETSRWLDQTIAAFGLGNLRAVRARATLEALLADPNQKPGLALRAGVLYALVRVGAKPSLDELWRSIEPGRVSIHNWGYLRYVVRAAARLGARDQVGHIAALVAHPDYYLKREALQALAVLGDRSAARAAAAALDVEYPGIQREAANCLRALKIAEGPGQPKTVKQWRKWRDARWPPATDEAAAATEASPGAPSPASAKENTP
jgi:hypothetical protein